MEPSKTSTCYLTEQKEVSNFTVRNMKAYTLSNRDQTFVTAVSNRLQTIAYHELFSVDNHLLTLDSMRKKLTLIAAGERRQGMHNWVVRQNIHEINSLISRLYSVRKTLFSKL